MTVPQLQPTAPLKSLPKVLAFRVLVVLHSLVLAGVGAVAVLILHGTALSLPVSLLPAHTSVSTPFIDLSSLS